MNAKTQSFPLIISCLALLSANPIHAADYTWSGGGTDANFSTAQNWVGGSAPAGGGSTYHTYTFTGSTPYQNPILPGGSQTTSNWWASSIIFTNTAASFDLGIVSNQTTNRFQMSAAGTIVQNSDQAQTITATLYLPGGSTSTVTGTGAGALTIKSVRMQQNGSVLDVRRQLTLGDVVLQTPGGSSKVSVGQGGDLTFSGTTAGQLENLELGVSSPAQQVTIRAGHADGVTIGARVVVDTVAFAGSHDITFTGNASINGSSNKTLSFTSAGKTAFSSQVQLGAANGTGTRTVTLDVASGATAAFSGGVTGSTSSGKTSLLKGGGGLLILSGPGTDLNGDFRSLNGVTRFESGYTVGGTRLFGGMGRIEMAGGDLTFQDSAVLAVGEGINDSAPGGISVLELGIASGNAAVTLGNGTSLHLDVWGDGEYEQLGFQDGFTEIALGGTLFVDSNFTGWSAGQSFTLFGWGDNVITGEFDAFALPDVSGYNLAWDTSGLYSTGALSLSVIPEPGTYTLVGAGLLAALCLRRRNFRRDQ